MRDTVWLYYVWGPSSSIGASIDGNEQAARRELQDLIDLFHLPPGKWYRGSKGAVL